MAKKSVKTNSDGLIVLSFDKRLKELDRSIKSMAEEMPEENVQIVTVKDYVNVGSTEHGVIRNVGRDLSNAYDGLNFIERRTLWTCFTEGYTHNKPPAKIIDIIGRAMTNWYPHGDGAMLGTIWRIGRESTNMIPYLDSKGNYGNLVVRKGGASRYIGGRLSKFSMDCFFSEMNVRKYIMDMKDNYKFDKKEPMYLPTKYPNWGLHWSKGIGYGASMDLPAFNLKELFETTIKLIDDPKANIVMYPDTPNDVVICNKSELKHCFDKHSFKIKIRGKYRVEIIEDIVGGRKVEKPNLVFTSIPHCVEVKSIVTAITEAVTPSKGKKNDMVTRFKEIKDMKATPVGDNGLNFYIEYEKGYDPQALAEKLYKSFDFEKTIGAVICMTKDNNVIKYTPRQLCLEWIETRRDQKRRYILQRLQTVMIDKLTNEAFIRATELDRTALARIASENKDDASYIKALIKIYNISELEANVLANTKNTAYTEANIKRVKQNIKKYIDEYERLRKLISSEELIDNEIKEELRSGIEKYAKPRMAMLMDLDTSTHDPEEVKIVAYNPNQYFADDSIPALMTIYDKLDNNYDIVQFKNKDGVLVFSEDGYIKHLDGFAFSMSSDGISLATTGINKTIKMLPITNKVKYVCIVTEKGFAKILDIDECTKSTKTKCINLSANDKIADVVPVTNLKGYISLMTDDRMYYVATESISVQKRGSAGYKVIKEEPLPIKAGGMFFDETEFILMMGEYGYCKCVNKAFLHYNKKIDNYVTFNGKNLLSIIPMNEKGRLEFIYELGGDIREYQIEKNNLSIYPLISHEEEGKPNWVTRDIEGAISLKLASSISTPVKTFASNKSGLFKIRHV